MNTFSNFNFENQRVLLREDLNVPLKNGVILDDTRLKAACPTIQTLVKAKASVIIISHLGRPEAGQYDEKLSLAPVAHALSQLLNQSVELCSNWETLNVLPGQVVLLENIRFEKGEVSNDSTLAQKLASLCDCFVMDAFAVAHRASASTVGVIDYVKHAMAGPLLEKELNALEQALTHPALPLVAIVGGSKVSSKLTVLKSLLKKVDTLIVGGGIANTFLKAASQPVGDSLVEDALVEQARQMLVQAQNDGKSILLPIDVVVANEINATKGTIKAIKSVEATDKIFDIGPRAIQSIERIVKQAKTVIWNGPLGVFENVSFETGTRALAQSIAASEAFSLAGGGETLAAISQFNVSSQISSISTGGGAFLEWLAGDELPAVAALKAHHK